MVSTEHFNSKPLYVSLNGRLKECESWVIFDHYEIVDDQLFLIGLDMEDNVVRTLSTDTVINNDNIEYSLTYLTKQAQGMNDALQIFKKIHNEKGE